MLLSWQLRSTGGDSRDSGSGLLVCASLSHLVDQQKCRRGSHCQATANNPSHRVGDGGGKATQCTNASHCGSKHIAFVVPCFGFLCATQGSCARHGTRKHGRPSQSAHNAFCALHELLSSTWPRQSAGRWCGSWSAHGWLNLTAKRRVWPRSNAANIWSQWRVGNAAPNSQCRWLWSWASGLPRFSAGIQNARLCGGQPGDICQHLPCLGR